MACKIYGGDGGGEHWLVRMEWRPAGWSMCLPSLPLHHEVQKFSSGTVSSMWSRKKGRKTVVVWYGRDIREKWEINSDENCCTSVVGLLPFLLH